MNLAVLQEKVRRLEGVEAVRVVADSDGIDEIHLLARPTKPPKQLVRDVQTLSQVILGRRIDRRVVSIVQLADSDVDMAARPELVDITDVVGEEKAETTVTLRWRQDLLRGEMKGADSAVTRPRRVAQAAVDAVSSGLDSGAADLASVDVVQLGGHKVAVAQVILVTEGAERRLVGSAFADEDETKAIVKAVLDSLNRFLPSLML